MQNRTKVRRRVLACARCRKRKLSVDTLPTLVMHVLTLSSVMARCLRALVAWMPAYSVLDSILRRNKKLRGLLRIFWKRTSLGLRAKAALHQRCNPWDNQVLPCHLQQIPTCLIRDREIGVQRNVPSLTAWSTRSWKTSRLLSLVSARPGPSCSASSKARDCLPRRDLSFPMI